MTASHPLHVVTAWIGNTPEIAREHYLQVRYEDFERATRTPTGAAQNPAQYAAEQGERREEVHGMLREFRAQRVGAEQERRAQAMSRQKGDYSRETCHS